MTIRHDRARRRFLTSVSALALLGQAYGIAQAEAAGASTDRPPLWLEFGWHYAQVGGIGLPLSPSFFDGIDQGGFTSPLTAERAIGWSYGGDTNISFEPGDTGLIFSVGLRYGRAHGRHHLHEQTNEARREKIGGKYQTLSSPIVENFSDTKASNSDTHVIADFQVGKDVGIGLFGQEGTSVVNFGVRFAQFKSRSHAEVYSIPDYYFPHPPHDILKYAFHQHNYHAVGDMERDFRSIGPSLSWDASAAIAGNSADGEISLDWGVNGAILFARQTVRGHHVTSGHYYYRKALPLHQFSSAYQTSGSPNRSRRVTIPNIGGFAGLSYRFTDAKLSVGYRADIFVNAIDRGIDTRTTANRTFYGPYASISIGLGD